MCVRQTVAARAAYVFSKIYILHLFALPALVANILIRHGHILRKDVNIHTESLFYFLRHELYAPVSERVIY